MTSHGDVVRTALADAVSLWRLDPKIGAPYLVDAATEALVAGLDSPSLAMLAGESPKAPRSDLMPLVEDTMAELDMPDVVTEDPERAAMAVMLRRLKAGGLGLRELTTWAHRHIGHTGHPDCQPFVDLHDSYNLADDLDYDYDVDVVDRWVHEEAEAFLAGRPSPRSEDGWWPPPRSVP